MLNAVIRAFAYFTVIKNANRLGETFSAWKKLQKNGFLIIKMQAKQSDSKWFFFNDQFFLIFGSGKQMTVETVHLL